MLILITCNPEYDIIPLDMRDLYNGNGIHFSTINNGIHYSFSVFIPHLRHH